MTIEPKMVWQSAGIADGGLKPPLQRREEHFCC
jgi:hypothetical protein